MKEIGTVVRLYVFRLKSAKSSVIGFLVKKACLRISIRLNLMNNKDLNTWLKYIYIYLRDIVIKNQITPCLIKLLIFVDTIWCIEQGRPYQILVLSVQIWTRLLCASYISSLVLRTSVQKTPRLMFRVAMILTFVIC